MDAPHAAWVEAGLQDVVTRVITVRRTAADFNDFRAITVESAALGLAVAALPPETIASLQEHVRARLPTAADGTITYPAWAWAWAWAWAIRGRKPLPT